MIRRRRFSHVWMTLAWMVLLGVLVMSGALAASAAGVPYTCASCLALAATSSPTVVASGTPVAVADTSSITASLNSLPVPVLIGIGVMGVLLLVLLIYFFIWQPRRKRALLVRAQKLVARDETSDLEEADDLLNQALTAGMRPRDVAEARFTLGYVRARLEQYSEAATVIADLRKARKTGKADAETMYLDMWVQFKLEKYDAVERLYEEHQNALKTMKDSKLIVGIAYLRLARQSWQRNDVSRALDYYHKVQHLEVAALNKRIPDRIDSQQVVTGIRALLDNRLEEARKQFTGALNHAKDSQQDTLEAELGLLLCDWREKMNIDTPLGMLVRDTQRFRVPVAPIKPAGIGDEKPELPIEQRLSRNVRFLYVMSLVIGWQRLPASGKLPDTERKEVSQRLDQVRRVDSMMPDVDLIDGLISYYFSKDTTEHDAGLQKLKDYQEHGGNLTDVLALMEREKRLAEANQQSVDRFLRITRGYLEDPSVREDLRRQLLDRLNPFSRFSQLGDVELPTGETDTAPSLEDLQNRSRLLRNRVEKVVKPRLSEMDEAASNSITEQVKAVDELTDTITKTTDKLQEAEFGLLATAGELLLKEEDTTATAPPPAASIKERPVSKQRRKPNG